MMIIIIIIIITRRIEIKALYKLDTMDLDVNTQKQLKTWKETKIIANPNLFLTSVHCVLYTIVTD